MCLRRLPWTFAQTFWYLEGMLFSKVFLCGLGSGVLFPESSLSQMKPPDQENEKSGLIYQLDRFSFSKHSQECLRSGRGCEIVGHRRFRRSAVECHSAIYNAARHESLRPLVRIPNKILGGSLPRTKMPLSEFFLPRFDQGSLGSIMPSI